MTVKILLADDHNVVRQGVQTFLELDPGIKVVGTAASGTEAIQKALELKPEVILMDLMMPEMDGIDATVALKRQLPDIKIIIFTGMLETNAINRAAKAGANGFILKSTNCLELCQAVKNVMTGQFLISPEAILFVSRGATTTTTKSLESLTSRETEVLKFVCAGKANKEIANTLGLSEGTIKTHVSIIMAKLGLQSRTQAALYAFDAGLLDHEYSFAESKYN